MNSKRIEYVHGDLFSDKESALLHACNCKKTWGRGVAAQLRERFPLANETHKMIDAKPGDVFVIYGNQIESQAIVCLFTSNGYGSETDSVDDILNATHKSLEELSKFCQMNPGFRIASPKINAGLFRVPWEKTEALIESFLEENPTVVWKVYFQ